MCTFLLSHSFNRRSNANIECVISGGARNFYLGVLSPQVSYEKTTAFWTLSHIQKLQKILGVLDGILGVLSPLSPPLAPPLAVGKFTKLTNRIAAFSTSKVVDSEGGRRPCERS